MLHALYIYRVGTYTHVPCKPLALSVSLDPHGALGIPLYTGTFSYLPFPAPDCALEPAFVRRRNERERQRVRSVNQGYARLRARLPTELEDRRLSKVETLRAAIGYIKHLQELLDPPAAEPLNNPQIPNRRSRSS
uniref:BHLH domain-containing protein n=1 Tax=Denticeps clupeoides TaxID=299321 RepID=A0AAY4EMB4_9TELE